MICCIKSTEPSYDESIFIKIVKTIGWGVLGSILALSILLLFFLMIWCIPVEKHHYEYIDLDNNKGIATTCSYEQSRGQGSPVCVLGDGTVKQVKEYIYVYEGSYRPIDDLFKGE